MNLLQIIIFLLIVLIVTILISLTIIISKINILKNNNNDYNKDISDLKFSQQTQYMNILKSLSDEFGQLKENVVININKYNEQTIKEILIFHNRMNNDLFSFKEKLQKELALNLEKLNQSLVDNLDKINEKVELRLNEGFEKTSKTFNNILERLSKIDEAQKKIDSLSTNIISLQDVLTDKKSRGTFGEVQLNNILISIFGENNNKIYDVQKKLSNNKIVDAILFTPEPLGNICIDSKFPLENYKKMIDRDLDESLRNEALKLFKQDVKNHINDIKEKYIIPNETATSAIMFIPAEAIFAEINAYHQDLIEYSQKSQVWLASPTTLMFLLTTVQVILRNIERDKYASIIHKELNMLGTEFKRYKLRWDKLSKNIEQVSMNVKELHTTSDKIERHFDSISKVELKNKELFEKIPIDILEEDNNE